MSNLCPGYTGLLFGPEESKIRCTDFGVIRQQPPLFYDHVIGLRDTIPVGMETKGEGATINIQKTIERPGVKIISGGFSFPATELNCGVFFDKMKYGDYFDFAFIYSGADKGFKFIDCRVNTYSFSVTAGDIATISVDILGKDAEPYGRKSEYVVAEKMITWDKVQVANAPGGSSGVQGIDFSVNNNLIPIYTSNNNVSENLKVKEIRVGMQEMTGALTVYRKYDANFDLSSPTTMTLTCPGLATPLNVVFQPTQPASALGPIITKIPFTGIDKAFGV